MKISFTYTKNAFKAAIGSFDAVIADASQYAMQQVLQEAEARGKADILSAGLGARWAQSLDSKFYPNDGINTAGLVFSPINFGVVFEKGATIRGNPTLWIPLHTTPKKVGGKRMTAKRFNQEVARLFKIKIDGKDYLAARVAVSKSAAKGSVQPRSVAQLKRRRGRRQRWALVPMFVGKSQVEIKKRLHIGEIVDAAFRKFPSHYASAIKDE